VKKAVIFIAIAALFGAGVWLGLVKQQNDRFKLLMQDRAISVLRDPPALTAFRLTDQDGKPFDLARLRGKWSLLFFGYTHCPDVCPTTLATMKQLFELLGRSPDTLRDLQFVFVSVDPKRDPPARLKAYVDSFNEAFIGATGEADEIAGLAKQLGAYYEVLDSGGKSDYPVNHSAAIFVIDERARYVGLMSPPLDPKAMASRLDLVRKLY